MRIFIILAFLFTLAVPGPAAAQPTTADTGAPLPVISAINVTVNGEPGPDTERGRMALELIRFKPGDTLSPELLADIVDALKRSKRFSAIHVEEIPADGGIRLVFSLTSSRLIKDIRVENASPLFEQDVLNAMTVFIGDAFFPDGLPGQEQAVREVYLREGFIDPKVKIRPEIDGNDGRVVLHVEIEKGPYLTLDTLAIEGNRAISDFGIKRFMAVWWKGILPGDSGRYMDSDLTKDVKKLLERYRSDGYPEAVVQTTVDKDPDKRRVKVTLTIAEGPRYDVTFEGNERFWDMTLKKDLTFFTSSVGGRAAAARSRRNIRERYVSAGYLSAKITVTEKDGADKNGNGDVRHYVFTIDEGPFTKVSSVTVAGNEAFSDEDVKAAVKTRPPGIFRKGAYVPDQLAADKAEVRSFYLKEGFTGVEVSDSVEFNRDKTGAAVTLDVDEGERTLVSSVSFEGLTVLTEPEALDVIRLKKGRPFRDYMLTSDENALSSAISEKGRPHVTVSGKADLSGDGREAALTFHVAEGPAVRMGPIRIQGNFRTKDFIILRDIDLSPGEPFSLKKLALGQKNLRNTGLFDSVWFKTAGLAEKWDEVHLFIEVEEKKPYYVEAGAGYETDKGVFANARAGDRNLFGTNKDGWVGAKVSEIGYRADSGLTEPRLFGTHVKADASLFAEELSEFNLDYTTRTFGATVGLSRPLWDHVTVGLTLTGEQRERTGDEEGFQGEGADELFEERRIGVLTPLIRYDSRDSFIRPKKGFLAGFSVDLSKGFDNDLDNFFHYRLDTRWFFTPFERLTLAFMGRAGYIDPYGSARRFPDDQILYLGGTADVRGYQENRLLFDGDGDPVGGRTQLAGSVEARITLVGNLEGALFYDVGMIEDTIQTPLTESTRGSVGLGLRYITPIGPVGLLYGFKLDPQDGESSGRFHFSLGYTF